MKKRSRTKVWMLRLGLLLGAPCLLLLLLEGILQLLVEPPRLAAKREFLARSAPHYGLANLGMLRQDPHPDIRFALTPGFDQVVGGKRYRINNLGMRGAAAKAQKAPGTRRVLLLGDSYAFGLGVDQDETLAVQLEAALGSGVEVLNLGVPAYHTGQQLALLERDGFGYAPDAVVLVYFANDNVDLTFLLDPAIRMLYVDAMPLPLGLRQMLGGSIIYSYCARSYTRILERSGRLESTGTRHWPTTSARLARIAAACAQQKVPLLLLPIPGLDSSPQFFDPGHTYNQDHARVLGWAKAAGLDCVDARALMQAWSLQDDPRLSEAARRSPDELATWVQVQLGRKNALASAELLAAYQEVKLQLRPIEGLFCIPAGPHKDSHLNPLGYDLLARALAPRLRRLLGR